MACFTGFDVLGGEGRMVGLGGIGLPAVTSDPEVKFYPPPP